MNTDDRELLEAAAKAAGLFVVGPAPKYIAQGCNEHALIVRNSRGGDSVFDPLTDDGDALRLAGKRGLILDLSGATTGEVRYYIGDEQFSRRVSFEKSPEATRRAIVRAAAALVKP